LAVGECPVKFDHVIDYYEGDFGFPALDAHEIPTVSSYNWLPNGFKKPDQGPPSLVLEDGGKQFYGAHQNRKNAIHPPPHHQHLKHRFILHRGMDI
jgi:hypothetical protein